MAPLMFVDDAMHDRQAQALCPCPGGLVVKNGSKIRACTSADIPQPVSVISRAACSPGWSDDRGVAAARSHWATVSRTSNLPPDGMAWIALVHRFITTWCIWLESAETQIRPVGRRTRRSHRAAIPSAADHRPHGPRSPTRPGRRSVGCRRLNARICRTRSAAR